MLLAQVLIRGLRGIETNRSIELLNDLTVEKRIESDGMVVRALVLHPQGRGFESTKRHFCACSRKGPTAENQNLQILSTITAGVTAREWWKDQWHSSRG